MIRNRNLLAAMMFLVVFWAARPAAAMGFEFAIGGWIQAPRGTLGYKALGFDDILDVEQDLNYSDEFRESARLIIDMPPFWPSIYLMGTAMDFSATGEKADGFTFGDISFNVGPFNSETVLDSLDVAFFYGLSFFETAAGDTLDVDVGLNVRTYDYKMSINQATSGMSETVDGTLPIPMLFLAARFCPSERVALEAEVRGISYSGNDVYSLIGRVKVKLAGPLFAAAGYRFEKIDLNEKDVQADIELGGPFFEAGFSF